MLMLQLRLGLLLLGATGLTSCANFSPDGGMNVVAGVTSAAINKEAIALRTEEDAAAARAKVASLLRRPLTADAAVQMALVNNRGLQAAYNDLALAEADLVEQSLPPNPTISFMRIAGSAEIEIERRIITDILALATLPVRTEIARTRFQQAQLRAALETLRVAANTRRAYYRAVALRELMSILTQARTAADTASELAARLGRTGAMNKLDQAREQVFYADITAGLARTRQRAGTEREALTRLLGLWGQDIEFRLPDILPALPRRPQSLASIERDAISCRVDLQIARMELDALARLYELKQATRFINVLDAGYADKLTTDRETDARIRSRGFEVLHAGGESPC
jgi:outer membrane protein TolC